MSNEETSLITSILSIYLFLIVCSKISHILYYTCDDHYSFMMPYNGDVITHAFDGNDNSFVCCHASSLDSVEMFVSSFCFCLCYSGCFRGFCLASAAIKDTHWVSASHEWLILYSGKMTCDTHGKRKPDQPFLKTCHIKQRRVCPSKLIELFCFLDESLYKMLTGYFYGSFTTQRNRSGLFLRFVGGKPSSNSKTIEVGHFPNDIGKC